jgi:ribosome-binding protein aMBF1 (putative translation factor)
MDRQGKDTLKILIRKAGLSNTELAERLGTYSSHISDWNAGRKHPTLRTSVRLARELGVTLEELADSLGYLEIEDEETIE